MSSVDISDIAIIRVKNVDYRCIIHSISKSKATNLLKDSVLQDRGYINKKFCLKFQSIQSSCFLPFLLSRYKMVDNMDIYKSLNTIIGTVMKNLKML